LDPEALLKTLEDRLRQGLAGRDCLADRAEIVVALTREECGVVGRHREKERWLIALDLLKHARRVRSPRGQDRRSADVKREIEPVSEAIGKEELGHREGAVRFRDVQNSA